MRKIIVFMALVIVFCAFAQNTEIETVMEIQAERELADWIESMLYPIVGDNVAIVDMTLRYPSENLQVFGSTLDTERSLPGLPVARSSGVMPSEIAGEETYPTIVVKKVITIYLSKKLTDEMAEFVRQNVTSWVGINDAKGDKLEVKRELNLLQDEAEEGGSTIIKTQDYRNYIIMIGAILLVLMIVFLLIFSARMGRLSHALKEVNIPGLESVLRPHSVSQTTTTQAGKRSNEPVTVKLLPQPKTDEETIDFSFIEDLSVKGCGLLLAKEAPEHAAFVLSQLSPQYVSSFFRDFDGNTDILLRSMIKGKQLSKPEIAKLHKKLVKTQQEIMEQETLTYDNQSVVAGIVNYLSASDSESLYKKISTIDSSFANLMRKKVFLLEDIADLETNRMEILIRELDRDLLINYLSFAPQNIKTKFFNNMTSRNRQIFEDELQNITALEIKDQNIVKDQMLFDVRRIFAIAS